MIGHNFAMKNVQVEHYHESMSEMLSLENRGAVITGGAKGIGAEIALRLSEAGARVVLLDIDGGQAERTAREIAAESGGDVFWRHADVSEGRDVFLAAEWAAAKIGGIDIWINNAGIFPEEDPVGVTRQEFSRVLDINLLGSQIGTEAAVEEMRKKGGGGVIVNLAASPSFHPAGAYGAAKWALEGLTRGLAAHLGPENIRVVCVAPTIIDTPGVEQEGIEGAIREARHNLPLRQEGTADDVARAVHFLVSPAARWITGVTLPVDGGESALPAIELRK